MEQEIFSTSKSKMEKAVEHYNQEVSFIRTGRASTQILNPVKVDYYGAQTPLNQLCNINTNEASSIILSPYDVSVADEIVKAIQKSDLGFNPNNEDGVIGNNSNKLASEIISITVNIVIAFSIILLSMGNLFNF